VRWIWEGESQIREEARCQAGDSKSSATFISSFRTTPSTLHIPLPMSNPLQSLSRRTALHKCRNAQHDFGQIRHATLIKRPKRPYTFTQLVTLTDGSTYLHRTTSPQPVYRSTKDVRNSPLWNPSSQKLLNIEEDEAGKLRSFRAKFGRGWDAEAIEYTEDVRTFLVRDSADLDTG
jgi:hypothetical protein